MHRAARLRITNAITAIASIAGIVTLTFACSSADPNGSPLDGNQDSADAAALPSDNGGSTQCDPGPPPAPMDPASLPACCATGQKGAAHCVPTSKVPAGIASNLATCTGGACVPDTFIKDPSTKPAACKSLGGVDGVCLSVCVPQVAQYASLLPQDSCGADEKCAPCISPLDHKSTGACNIGKSGGGGTCAPASGGGGGGAVSDAGPPAPAECPHKGAAVLDPSTLPACGTASSGAHCLDKALVPAAMASQLAACPTGLCVPDDFISSGGNFIPATCRSLNDAEGRCLNENVPQVASQLSQLPTSTCQAFERCVPCFNPLDSKDTGSCRLSCDPGPKEAAKPFKECCTPKHATTPQGRCVPKAQIPQAEQTSLNQDECTANEQLCVPNEMLAATFTPTTCSGSTLLSGAYTGVCLSTCLHFGFIQQLGISQGSCDDLHTCAPCKNPLTGQSTGAPGCPP
jgi:hypothetical protein